MSLISSLKDKGGKVRHVLAQASSNSHPFRYICNFVAQWLFNNRIIGFRNEAFATRLFNIRFLDEASTSLILRAFFSQRPDLAESRAQKILTYANRSVFEEMQMLLMALLFSKEQVPSLAKISTMQIPVEHLAEVGRRLFDLISMIRFRMKVESHPEAQIEFFSKTLKQFFADGSSMVVDEKLLYRDDLEQAFVATVFEGGKYSFHNPVLFGDKQAPLRHEVQLRDVKLFRLSDARVVVSNQVLNSSQGKRFLVDEAGGAENGWVAGCWKFFVEIGKKAEELRLFYSEPVKVNRVLNQPTFLLGGRASGNYFHWLIEDLPKLLAFREQKSALSSVGTLLVDAEMPKQHFQALEIALQALGLDHLSIEKRQQHHLYDVSELYLSSIHTYHPDRFDIPYWMGGGLNPKVLGAIRELFLPMVRNEPPRFPKKFYIARKKAGARAIQNAQQIEEVANAHGFSPVYPEQLSFLDQLNLFYHATHIMAQSGAALVNILFTQPGVKVIAITSERNSHYPMYSNLAQFAGADFVHVVGKHILDRSRFAHEDFYVHSAYRVDKEFLDQAIRASNYEQSLLHSEK